jgi:acyl carrier protein
LDLLDRIKEILVEILNVESIENDAKQEDYAEWDSLTYLRIIGALEEEFKFEITFENIDKFNSVPNIVEEIYNAHNNS